MKRPPVVICKTMTQRPKPERFASVRQTVFFELFKKDVLVLDAIGEEIVTTGVIRHFLETGEITFAE